MHFIRVLHFLLLILVPLQIVYSEDKETTIEKSRHTKELDTIVSDGKPKRGQQSKISRVEHKERKVVETYHHVVKKILPPYDFVSSREENIDRTSVISDRETKVQEQRSLNHSDGSKIYFSSSVISDQYEENPGANSTGKPALTTSEGFSEPEIVAGDPHPEVGEGNRTYHASGNDSSLTSSVGYKIMRRRRHRPRQVLSRKARQIAGSGFRYIKESDRSISENQQSHKIGAMYPEVSSGSRISGQQLRLREKNMIPQTIPSQKLHAPFRLANLTTRNQTHVKPNTTLLLQLRVATTIMPQKASTGFRTKNKAQNHNEDFTTNKNEVFTSNKDEDFTSKKNESSADLEKLFKLLQFGLGKDDFDVKTKTEHVIKNKVVILEEPPENHTKPDVGLDQYANQEAANQNAYDVAKWFGGLCALLVVVAVCILIVLLAVNRLAISSDPTTTTGIWPGGGQKPQGYEVLPIRNQAESIRRRMSDEDEMEARFSDDYRVLNDAVQGVMNDSELVDKQTLRRLYSRPQHADIIRDGMSGNVD